MRSYIVARQRGTRDAESCTLVRRDMSARVRLKDIMDALEMQFEGHSSFLDCVTGEVETVSNDLLSGAEEGEEPDLPEWQRQEWEAAKQIVSTTRFLKLPTQFDIHEWQIMRDFADSLDSGRIRDDLLFALHGAGAFRHFKHAIRRYGIESAWCEYRAEALKEIAVEWCEEHRIEWE